MAGTIVADNIQAASTSTLVLKNGVASTPPTIQDSAGTEIGTFCRAWVNFNGTGTVAIRASFNVSSITDDGVGSYTVNFTNSLPDVNYCVVTAAPNNVNATSSNRSLGIFSSNASAGENSMLVGSVKLLMQGGNGTILDQSVACVSIFR